VVDQFGHPSKESSWTFPRSLLVELFGWCRRPVSDRPVGLLELVELGEGGDELHEPFDLLA
jgi:hypothetical protein